VKSWLKIFLPVSLAGGLLGSMLLTRLPAEVFSRLVPFLLLFATVIFLAQGAIGRLSLIELRHADGRPPARSALAGAMLFQFGVAVYGGYFGAGIGILMLASLGFLGLTHIHQMNALKTILGSAINLVATLWFVANGLVNWPKALVMTAGALGGYYLGSHGAQRIPQLYVRRLITGIGLAISAVMFYQEFK
jgi:uncharacterized membrane protein YfcA